MDTLLYGTEQEAGGTRRQAARLGAMRLAKARIAANKKSSNPGAARAVPHELHSDPATCSPGSSGRAMKKFQEAAVAPAALKDRTACTNSGSSGD
jgi:hypothetical protein